MDTVQLPGATEAVALGETLLVGVLLAVLEGVAETPPGEPVGEGERVGELLGHTMRLMRWELSAT